MASIFACNAVVIPLTFAPGAVFAPIVTERIRFVR